ncbi:MAG TPA: esterase-like activity of phytase family protein [Verrucomicrobiae bacterium]
MSVTRQLFCVFVATTVVFVALVLPEQSVTNTEHAANATNAHRKIFKLTAEDFWRLELPGGKRFDASGLVWNDGKLLTVDDGDPPLYEIVFGKTNVAQLKATAILTWPQMTRFIAGKHGRFDLEGIARDEEGRIYASEEANRWIFRWDPKTQKVERLEIDWSPVKQYFNGGDNASFEGVAVGGGKLWVANERERARVIEVDLATLKVVADYAPQPSTWSFALHYSDLSYFKGHLFLLLRHHQVILEIDPATHDVLAEYNYHSIEDAPQHAYHKEYPTGAMEGLAVDDNYFWLVTDNNGFGRMQDAADRRPTLFKCKRPTAVP